MRIITFPQKLLDRLVLVLLCVYIFASTENNKLYNLTSGYKCLNCSLIFALQDIFVFFYGRKTINLLENKFSCRAFSFL